MTRYNANLHLDWERVAGVSLAGDDDQVGDTDPNASGAVVTGDNCSSVAWQVTIDGIPLELSVKACTADKVKAVAAASAVAKQVQSALTARAGAAARAGDNVAATVLRALVPPQAAAAVKAARVVVGLVRSKRLRSVWGRLRGGARVLGQALAS